MAPEHGIDSQLRRHVPHVDGTEIYDITGIEALSAGKTPNTVQVKATKPDGTVVEFEAAVRIDTPGEADYGQASPAVTRR
jgi:aconitase A